MNQKSEPRTTEAVAADMAFLLKRIKNGWEFEAKDVSNLLREYNKAHKRFVEGMKFCEMMDGEQ